jgi:hypothetical protein
MCPCSAESIYDANMLHQTGKLIIQYCYKLCFFITCDRILSGLGTTNFHLLLLLLFPALSELLANTTLGGQIQISLPDLMSATSYLTFLTTPHVSHANFDFCDHTMSHSILLLVASGPQTIQFLFKPISV